MNEIKLGDKVRSVVSGFEGTVTAKCEYLHGATQYAVTAPVLVNGEVKTEWFQSSELEGLTARPAVEKQQEPFIQRIEEEKAQLDERIDKLLAFTRTTPFANLDATMQDLMFNQLGAMKKYSEILGDRLDILRQ